MRCSADGPGVGVRSSNRLASRRSEVGNLGRELRAVGRAAEWPANRQSSMRGRLCPMHASDTHAFVVSRRLGPPLFRSPPRGRRREIDRTGPAH